MQKAINEKDFERIIYIAHTVKGVVANLGGQRAQVVCTEMESLAVDNNFPKLKSILPVLLKEIEDLSEECEQYRSEFR